MWLPALLMSSAIICVKASPAARTEHPISKVVELKISILAHQIELPESERRLQMEKVFRDESSFPQEKANAYINAELNQVSSTFTSIANAGDGIEFQRLAAKIIKKTQAIFEKHLQKIEMASPSL